MSLLRRSAACSAILLQAALMLPVHAQIYKCTGSDGSLSYSQVPCPDQDSTRISTGSGKTSDINCNWAVKFAHDIARRMRTGRSSEATFAVYGGVDAVNAGTLNLINYVYRYEYANDVSTERIASLTGSMCRAGSLGSVGCEALPFPEDDGISRCETDSPDDYEKQRAAAAGIPLETVDSAEPQARPLPARSWQSESNAVKTCKNPLRDEMDRIYAAMREGYDLAQGEQYKTRLRELSRQYRACEHL